MRAPLLAVAVLLAACSSPGPAPVGKRIATGLPITLAIASNGSAVAVELRGAHAEAGDSREQVWILRAPFDGAPESVGRGSTLAGLSDDGRWIAWLSTKERGDRTGKARARAVAAKGAASFDLGMSMPPFFFGEGAMLSLTSYRGDNGRGTLQTVRLDTGARAPVLADAPPGGVVRIAGGFLALQRPGNGAPCRAMRLDSLASHPVPVLAGLDCESSRPPLVVTADGRRVLVRHGDRSLGLWDGSTETALGTRVEAAVFDGSGRAWWAERTSAGLRVRREGAVIGEADGRFARALYPAGDRGAWLLLADQSCTARALSATPACQRFVAVGDAPSPPDAGLVRQVVSAPGGFPLAFFAGDQTPPALLAVPAPGRVLPVSAEAVAAALSPDGRHLAAVAWLDDGERALLADLATGNIRELSTGVPSARVFWAGPVLLHTFETRKAWELFDERSGVYAVEP